MAHRQIFEREGCVLKTHKGVQTEFNRIMKDDARADMALVGYVARSYKFKTVADYGFDAIEHPSDDAARAALTEAVRFVDMFTSLLTSERD